jgi:DNA-binding CsgD family transcriptional regulator
MLGLASARAAAGDPAGAATAVATAVRIARAETDADLLAAAALVAGPQLGDGAPIGGRDGRTGALLREAIAAGAAGSTGARLAARLALDVAARASDPSALSGAADLAATAVDGAADSSDPRAIAEAVVAVAGIARYLPSAALGESDLRRAVRESSAVDDEVLECRTRLALAGFLLAAGRIDAAGHELTVLGSMVRRSTYARWAATQARAHQALLTGTGDVRALVAEAGAAGAAVDGSAASDAAQAILVGALVGWAGDGDAEPPTAIAAAILASDGDRNQRPWQTAAVALAHLATGHRDQAAASLAALVASPASAGDTWTATVLAAAVATLGDPRNVPAAAALLTATNDEYAVLGPALASAGPVAIWRQRLAALDPGARPAAADGPAGLTAREREIFARAVRGDGVRDIAADLVVSERTVETHLASIYRKLGVHSRLELVTRYGRGA